LEKTNLLLNDGREHHAQRERERERERERVSEEIVIADSQIAYYMLEKNTILVAQNCREKKIYAYTFFHSSALELWPGDHQHQFDDRKIITTCFCFNRQTCFVCLPTLLINEDEMQAFTYFSNNKRTNFIKYVVLTLRQKYFYSLSMKACTSDKNIFHSTIESWTSILNYFLKKMMSLKCLLLSIQYIQIFAFFK
jgi:hypothetical protein